MKLKSVRLLPAVGAVSIGAGVLLWYMGDYVVVRIISAALGTILLALSFMVGRSSVRYERLIQVSGTVLGVLLWIGAILIPTLTDRGSSWNEAVRAARVLQALTSKNAQYATFHQGSFALDLERLGFGAPIGRSYILTYKPVEGENNIVRHYTVQAAPQGTYWISLYTDETGVVRFSKTGPADLNSPPLF